MRRILCALALSLFAALPARAQNPLTPPRAGEELVDRVVAVVGDTALLLSDVQEEIERLRASGQTLPTDPQGQEAFFRQVLEQRVDDLVVLNAARVEKIEAPEAEVTRMVDQQVQQVQRNFGSEEGLRRALLQSGLSLEEYRANLTEQARAQLLSQRFMQKRMGTAIRPNVSEEEMRAFFAQQSAAMGTRPATISFEQVMVRPMASDSAKARARVKADSVLAEVRRGGDFEVLAKRYSEDPGSKERGGDLGWFRQGTMVRRFEEMAFALRPGDVSPVVETDFGFHIIKLEKVRGGERQARHILIRPEITDADRARARERADSVLAAVRAGAPVEQLAERYETPADQRRAQDFPLDRLPPGYGPALENAAPGAVVGPVEIAGGPDGATWAVIRVNERKAAGAYTLEDVREQVRQRIQESKVMEQLLRELRQTTYVNILV